VPGLEGRLTPHWGVYVPTRTDYLGLLEHLEVEGRTVIDLGTGTGIIGLMLLQRRRGTRDRHRL
jgi:16S rRNA G1207 methylase RsmC